MPFVVHEQTGSKVFSDPKLCEECLLYDQTHRQLILWVKLPRMACISRDFDYFIMHIIQIWSKRARTGISDHHKSACKYTSIQRIQTKFSQYIHSNTSFILYIKPWHDLQWHGSYIGKHQIIRVSFESNVRYI